MEEGSRRETRDVGSECSAVFSNGELDRRNGKHVVEGFYRVRSESTTDLSNSIILGDL